MKEHHEEAHDVEALSRQVQGLSEKLDTIAKRHDEKIEDISKDMRAIKTALSGDLQGNSGALHSIVSLTKTVHDRESGLITRMNKTENWMLQKESWISGAHFMTGVIGAVLVFFLSWLKDIIWKK